MLGKVIKRLNSQNYFLVVDDSVKNLIQEKGTDANYGARPIRRAVQNYIEDKIAEGILDGSILKNEKNIISVENGQIVLKQLEIQNNESIKSF